MFKQIRILSIALLAALLLTAGCSNLAQEDFDMNIAITVTVGDTSFAATLLDVPASLQLLNRLPLTIDMQELNGNEKYYYFDEGFAADSERVGSIQSGDLMLYGSDCLVLFYDSFSTPYSYTRLGSIDDPTGLAEALGRGNVTVSFEK